MTGMVIGSGLIALASLEASGVSPPGLAEYGIVGLFVLALLWMVKEVLFEVLKRNRAQASPTSTNQDEALRALAHSLDKLSLVLERMEKTSEKSQEETLAILRQLEMSFQGVDYRTKEMREFDRDALDRLEALQGAVVELRQAIEKFVA